MRAADKEGAVQDESEFDSIQSELGFAEDLERLLGTAELKATAWLGQRKAMLARLRGIQQKTELLIQVLLNDSDATEATPDRPRNWNSPESTKVSSSPAKRRRTKRRRNVLSADARARIAAAQKERWARYRVANGKG